MADAGPRDTRSVEELDPWLKGGKVNTLATLQRLPQKMMARSSTVVLGTLNGSQHLRAVLVYLVIVVGHFSEHLVQVAQVFLFGWERGDAGGILGLYLSGVAENELLHI